MKRSIGKHRQAGLSRPRIALFGVALALCAIVTGCGRKYWRDQADDLTYDIIESRVVDPRWQLPERIEVMPLDPRSRFYDPYDPDCEPLPPDDPAAHEYMHSVYGMRGYKRWHDFGDTRTVENPYWLEPYGLPPEVVENNAGHPGMLPEFKSLSLVHAIRLAYIHSRDYQLQLENLYLTGLPLTLERFRFDVQFFGISNRRPSDDATFESIPGGPNSIDNVGRVGVNKLLPSGGQWLAELTNNTLWLFSGGNSTSSTATSLSYSIVQPLLANGGRIFTLENLTQSERNVLYAVRNFSRFRMGFFSSTVAGGGSVGTNFTSQNASSSIGTNFTSSATGATVASLASGGGGGSGPVGGYLGMLQQYQQILNQRDNIRRTEEQLKILRAKASERPAELGEPLETLPPGLKFPESMAGRIRYEDKALIWRGDLTDVQVQELLALSKDQAYQEAIRRLLDRFNAETVTLSVAQLETQLANSRISLITNERQLQDAYDSYKIQLGLPTDTIINVDKSLLRPFELIDQKLMDQQDRITDFVTRWALVDEEDADIAEIRTLVGELAELRNDVLQNGIAVVEHDFKRAADNYEDRMATLPDDVARENFRQDAERDRRLFLEIRAGFQLIESDIATLQKQMLGDQVPVEARRQMIRQVAELREDLLKVSQGLAVVQIDLRVELIKLRPFDKTMEEVMAIALENRVDLMNARAQVMDARRKMEVAANQLKGILNIVANGDIRTRDNLSGNQNPFDFRGEESSFRAGIQFTTPIQLVQQRNIYRSSLIFYQQARRNYMLTEDQIKQQVRVEWRQLTALRKNFELARQSLRMAALQYDQAVEQTAAPVPASGASQGLQLLQALGSVLNANNNLIGIWASYETNRLNIYRDMNIMEIDEQGFWNDDYYQEMLRDAPIEIPPVFVEDQVPNGDLIPGVDFDEHSETSPPLLLGPQARENHHETRPPTGSVPDAGLARIALRKPSSAAVAPPPPPQRPRTEAAVDTAGDRPDRRGLPRRLERQAVARGSG